MLTRFILLCIGLSLKTIFAYPQLIKSDTAFIQDAAGNSIALYAKAILGHAALYNGSEYVEPEQTGESHPFFGSDDWVVGRIKYDGDIYDNVHLLYDITSDRIITEQFYNGTPIALVSQKVSWFTIAGHLFERIQKEQVSNTIPQTGFYEILYGGTTKLIARKSKHPQQILAERRVRIDFEDKERFYVLKNGKYHSVKNKGSILKLLEDEKHALKQYIRTEKIQFRQNADAALAAVAKQYDALKNNLQ